MTSLIDDGYAWTAKRIAAVQGTGLDAPTPCAEWSLRQLLNHLLGALDLHLDAMSGSEGDRGRLDPDTDRMGDDPARAFAAATDRAARTWRAPLDRMCVLPVGTVPGSVLAMLHLTEVVVHGWDIGQATGERAAIPTGLAAPILEFCRQFTTDAHRGTAFAGELPSSSDTPAGQLLAFLGRTA